MCADVIHMCTQSISIHALLAESDTFNVQQDDDYIYISIHALLAESDRVQTNGFIINLLFLSTLSLRRATVEVFSRRLSGFISIHALLAESDFLRLFFYN